MAMIEEEPEFEGQEEVPMGQGELHVELEDTEPNTAFHRNAVGCSVTRPQEEDWHCALESIYDGNSTCGVLFSKKVADRTANDICELRRVPDEKLPQGSYGAISRRRDQETGYEMAVKTITDQKTFRTDEVLFPLRMRRLCESEEPSLTNNYVEPLGVVKASTTLHVLMTPVAQNIGFVFDKRLAVLLDFGTARWFVEGDKFYSYDGMTLMYMAPELFRYILCKKADVYGVALVMYYLIYGKHMWPDASMLKNNIFEFFKWLTPEQMLAKIPSNLPEELRDLLIWMSYPDMRLRLTAEEALKHPYFLPLATPHQMPGVAEEDTDETELVPLAGAKEEEDTEADMDPEMDNDETELVPLAGANEENTEADMDPQMSLHLPDSPGGLEGDQQNQTVPGVDGQDNDETQLMQLVGGNEEDAEIPDVVDETWLTQMDGGNTEADKDPEKSSNVKTSGFFTMESDSESL